MVACAVGLIGRVSEMVGLFDPQPWLPTAVTAVAAAGGVAEVTSEGQTRERAPNECRQTAATLLAFGLDSTGSLPTVVSKPPCWPGPPVARQREDVGSVCPARRG